MSELTGKWMVVRSRGRMAIKVQVREPHWSDNPGQYVYYWVWATEEHLSELEFYSQPSSARGNS